MSFTERLAGTSLENDNRAKQICAILDWCMAMNYIPPTEKEWCRLLGSFPKGKVRHGEEKKNYFPQNQVHALLMKLDEEGVVAITWGKGRGRSSYGMPDEKNLDDKKADYEKRKARFADEVKEKLRVEVEEKNSANWDGVNRFIEYWSEHDAEYNMKMENLLKDTNSKYFSIRGRWRNWKEKVVEENIVATPQPEKEVITQSALMKQQDKLFHEWLNIKGISEKEFDPDTMFQEVKKYIEEHS